MTRAWQQVGFAFLDSGAQVDEVTREAERLGRDAAEVYYCSIASARVRSILGRTDDEEPTGEPVWRVATDACSAAYARAWWTRWHELCEVEDYEAPDEDGDTVPFEPGYWS